MKKMINSFHHIKRRHAKLFYFSILIAVLTVQGCTNKFDDFNTDDKNPDMVAGEALLSNAQKELSDQINTPEVNLNIFMIWAQHWTETTYTDEANYDILNRNIADNTFDRFYLRVLKDLNESARILEETGSSLGEDPAVLQNKLHIITILEVYVYQNLVDIFGMVPYKDALNIENVHPAYDAGMTIYSDLLTRLDEAITGMDPAFGSFDNADLYYGGAVENWIRFANTLKVKMGIIIADADPQLARTAVESGALNCFGSSADDCKLQYMQASPNFNPIYNELVATGRHDYVPANTLVDIMNELQDPRREKYFTPMSNGQYSGGQYGYSSPYEDYSHISDTLHRPDFPGIILTYTELLFYLAEAAERGFHVPESAAAYYTEGIRESFAFWGANNVDAYLTKPDVTYATAPGTWKQKIALQSWLAAYTRGLDAYTTWRRLDYPILNTPEFTDSYSNIPVRFTFPVNEQTLNSTNYKAAAEAIGGDKLTTKIFWDKF
jgi:hypothetical protein